MPKKREPLMNGKTERRTLRELYRAALAGVNPRKCVEQALKEPQVAEVLKAARSVGVFAVGKAAAGLVRGARGAASRGIAILPRGSARFAQAGIEVLHSSHPEPDRSSVRAARRTIAFFESFGSDEVILCLVSGGTSSLLALPRPGVTLAEKRRRVARLSDQGASILEINH